MQGTLLMPQLNLHALLINQGKPYHLGGEDDGWDRAGVKGEAGDGMEWRTVVGM